MSPQGESRDYMFTTVLGKEIYYEILNEQFADTKPFIVFLHDALGSVAQWKSFPQKISDLTGLPVLLYDRYGYGKSEALHEKRNRLYLHQEAQCFLPELLKSLNITKPIFLYGHSDGATIVLIYASSFPSNVLGFISEAGHPIIEEITLAGVNNAVKKYECGNLKRWLEHFHGEKSDSVIYDWSDVWEPDTVNNWSIKDMLCNITAPVLLIQGKEDDFGSQGQIDVVMENVKGRSEVAYIPNCGHFAHFNAREFVINRSAEFVKSVMGDLD
jgi:pimeloyl-ACP methyl ester carboxylesterase